jgi:hypothetical protein
VEVSGLLHASAALPHGKESPAPFVEEVGWTVDDLILPGLELLPLGRRQSLYRLSHRGASCKRASLFKLINMVIHSVGVTNLRIVVGANYCILLRWLVSLASQRNYISTDGSPKGASIPTSYVSAHSAHPFRFLSFFQVRFRCLASSSDSEMFSLVVAVCLKRNQ